MGILGLDPRALATLGAL
ncbi:Protein of unknown function [Bacillus wiedmannii]|nr:Protein of unknown function [Bacillus wiedmannii]